MSTIIAESFDSAGDDFLLVLERLSFQEAIEACEEMKATLARISTRDEFDFVVGLNSEAPQGTSVGDTWIGVRTRGNMQVTSSYEYVDGYPDTSFLDVGVGIFPWDAGDPNLGINEACVDISLAHSEPRWENRNCNTRKNYLCRRKITEPLNDEFSGAVILVSFSGILATLFGLTLLVYISEYLKKKTARAELDQLSSTGSTAL